MYLSINLLPEAPLAEVVEVAVAAERLGYTRCWVYDEGLAARDVYVTLAAIGQATKRLIIGTGITNPFTRHPAMTATAIATLDELTGGRAFVGLGAGGSLTLDPLGVDRSRSLTAVGETIVALKGLFSGEATDLSGSAVILRGATLGYARSDIEVWLAGRGPKMLALGGKLADGVMLEFIHRDLLGEQFEHVRAAGEARLSYSTMVITDEASMAITRPHMTYRLIDSPPAVQERIGLTRADISTIRSAMASGLEPAGEHVRDEWVYPFVIHGSVAECAARMRDLEASGVEEFVLPVLQIDGAVSLMEKVAAVFAS